MLGVPCVLQAAVKSVSNNGGAVAVDTMMNIAGREVYIAFPNVDRTGGKVLFAFHGSGREVRSYVPGDPKSNEFYIYQRNLALRCGYIFVVASFGKDIWGKEDAIKDFQTIYTCIIDLYKVDKDWVGWSTSAGGVLLANVLKYNSGIIKKAIGTFPVYDLEDTYVHLASAKQAWTDKKGLKEHNPAKFPEVFINIPYLIFHGLADKAVPIERHSLKLYKDLKKMGWEIEVQPVNGGHSVTNWNMYNEKLLFNFLNSH